MRVVFEDVKAQVDAGKWRHEVPTSRVDLWMKQADQIWWDVEQLMEEYNCQETQGIVSSRSDQRNAKLIVNAEMLKANLDEKPEEPVMVELPQEPLVGAESLFKNVWDWASQDESVRCIGLFGMGGAGKTALLKRVHNQFTQVDQKVCEKMQPDKKMKVECLPRDKAYELFKLKVGVEEKFWKTNPGIWEIAKAKVDECKDLPLAIITVARAMSGTTEHRDWADAKEELKTRLSRFEDMPKKVLETLNSYDRLPDETHKQCFLYLSIFPDDQKIFEDDAIRLWVGEGLVQNIVHGKRILTRLGQASLVESVNRYSFKMHDLVREMAVWVYNKSEGGQNNENRVVVQVGSLQAGELTKWKNAERISLWGVDDDGLRRSTPSTVPSCRRLSTLMLRDTKLREIPDVLFRSMPQLRVLHLEGNSSLRRLPDSIWTLRELRYLNLRSTIRVDVEWRKIEDLSKLEVLILSRNVILSMGKITKEAKSSLSSLRIFHWFGSFHCQSINNEVKVVDVLLMQGSLEEICITLRTSAGFARLMESPNLHSRLRRLKLVQIRSLRFLRFCTSNRSNGGFKHLESLTLDYCRIKDIKIDDGVSFEGLRDVTINKCEGLKNLTQLIHHAPSLRELFIYDCKKMTTVISRRNKDSHVTGDGPLFSCLRVLDVRGLPKLKSICTRALPFPSLEVVQVVGCPKLKKFPLDRNSGKDTLQFIRGEQRWWNTLEWEDAASKQVLSAKFRGCSKAATMTRMNQHSFPRSYAVDADTAERSMLYIVHYHSSLVSSSFLSTGDMIYTIHALDFDCLAEPRLILTLRHNEFPCLMGVGRVGSSIYFIGGLLHHPLPRHNSRDVYIFDTRDVRSYDRPIKNPQQFLKKGPELKAAKLDPIVVTVGGKIYVIARSFDPSQKVDYPEPRVEVLDPVVNEWKALPEPEFQRSSTGICNYKVGAFDVVGSRIILWIEKTQWFELDTELSDEKWVARSSDIADRKIIGKNVGSEVIDELVFPWFPLPSYQSKTYLISLNTASDADSCVEYPSPGNVESPITSWGTRRLLDCGGGRAVVFSSGYDESYDKDARQGPLFYTFEVIRLEKHGKDVQIYLVLEKSLSYKVGITDYMHQVCGCFVI